MALQLDANVPFFSCVSFSYTIVTPLFGQCLGFTSTLIIAAETNGLLCVPVKTTLRFHGSSTIKCGDGTLVGHMDPDVSFDTVANTVLTTFRQFVGRSSAELLRSYCRETTHERLPCNEKRCSKFRLVQIRRVLHVSLSCGNSVVERRFWDW